MYSFGFVTYDSENDASKVLSLKEEDLIFKENKLNIGHAFRKKNFVSGYNNNGMGGGMGSGQMNMGGMNMGGMGMQNAGGLGGFNGNGGGLGGNLGVNHLPTNTNTFLDPQQMGNMHHMTSMNGLGMNSQMHHQMNLPGGFGNGMGLNGFNGMNA